MLLLAADGRVLLELGRGGKSGREPGEFKKPSGVALDAQGAIYVADTGNGRVQIFSSSGAFTRQFPMPPRRGPGSHDDAEDEGLRFGEPVAVAVDAAGRIYIADRSGGRALRFSP